MSETKLKNAQNGSTSTETETQTSLRIRAVNDEETKKHLSWDEAVIDNENLGKKKSKVCCIFHKEGDSDEDSCGSDDDDEPNAYEKLPKRCKGKGTVLKKE